MRIICFLLTLSMLVSCNDTSSEINAYDVSELVREYKLKQVLISSIPEGVSPIKFNSVGEARAFMANRTVKEQYPNPAQTTFSTSKSPKKNYANLTSCANPLNAVYTQQVSAGIFSSITFTSYTSYNYCGLNFSSVNNISSSMTGATLGASYAQSNYSVNVNDTSISYTIYGTIDYYLFVEGGLNLWSQNVSLGGSFTSQVIGTTGTSGGNPRGSIAPSKK